jgi:hypothetical protein
MTKEIGKEKKWIITFSNGYCGCDIEEEFVGTYEEAVEWANEYLPDYAEDYIHIAFGWNEEYTEEEYDDYLEDCSYDIEESEEEE